MKCKGCGMEIGDGRDSVFGMYCRHCAKKNKKDLFNTNFGNAARNQVLEVPKGKHQLIKKPGYKKFYASDKHD